MFAITKAERDRHRYVLDVRGLMAETFNLSQPEMADQDLIWGKWLRISQREGRDLYGLLKTDVKDVFHARALAILLMPRKTFAPFEWRNDKSFSSSSVFEEGVTPFKRESPLQNFALAILEMNIDVALASNDHEDVCETLSCYNKCILQALVMLEENDLRAARLFERYQMNDPVAFWNMDDASGYNPFYAILNADVPERWKKLADDKMREVIRAEKAGRSQPRNDWEKAFQNYRHHIQFSLYKDPFPYSVDLFASQVDFVLGFSLSHVHTDEGRILFHSYHAYEILAMLQGDRYKEIRHRFVRHMLLGGPGECGAFKVYNEKTYAAVMMMLEEFKDTDPDLRDRLGKVIAEAKMRISAERAVRRSHKDQVDTVMAQMR